MSLYRKLTLLGFFLTPLSLTSGIVAPEFVVTIGGERYSRKLYLAGAVAEDGDLMLAWLDWRDGGSNPNNMWMQTYVQYVDPAGNPQGSNARIETGSDFTYFSAQPACALFNDGMALVGTSLENRVPTDSQYDNPVVRLWDADAGFVSSPLAEFPLSVKLPLLVPYGNENFLALQNIPTTFLDTNYIAVERYKRTGEKIGESQLADTGSVYCVISDEEGAFTIGYAQKDGPYYYRRFDKDGNPAGERTFIDSVIKAYAFPFCIAGGVKGTVICVWSTYDENYGCYIWLQRFSADDQPIGSKTIIASGSSTAPVDIHLVQKTSTNYLLVYSFDDSYTLYGQFLNVFGDLLGAPFTINDTNAGGELTGFWAGVSNKGFHVAWIQGDHVYAREITFGGSLKEECIASDDEPGYYPEWNEPVLTSDDDVFILWNNSINTYNSTGAYLRHFRADGTPDTDVWGSDEYEWAYPSLGLDGKLYLSYHTIEANDKPTICVQRFNENGLPDGNPLTISQSEASDCYSTAVAVGDDGKGMVTWEERAGNSATNVWLKGQLFDKKGLIGKEIQIDSFYSRRGLRAFAFEDGGFVLGSGQQKGNSILYMFYFYNSAGNPEREPMFLSKFWSTTQNIHTIASNGNDRFVAGWMTYEMDAYCFVVYNRDGNIVGEPYRIELPRIDYHPVKSLFWGGYYPSISMAPDGKFIITWQEPDAFGNLNLRAQAFSKDGVPVSGSFQVNEPDQWPYSFQISGWRGVSCNNDRILFTWLENRNHRGWDVIAKVTDWEDFPGVEEGASVKASQIKLASTLNRLSWDVPDEAVLTVYNSAGRKVAEAVIHDKGEWTAVDIPSGVYFAVIETGSESVSEKVVIIR